MGIEESVKRATCRVDLEREQGSAFWVEEGLLITAAHVTNATDSNTVEIQTASGNRYDATISEEYTNSDQDPGPDLAVLETSETPEECQTLSLNPEIPDIGEEVFWSGYARLPGESKLDRQRFGWGRVASESYGDEGSFFEVDGLFNPSHSGGPVVDRESEEVVGVVSASAGGFEELERQWSKYVEQINALFNFYNQASQGGMFRAQTFDDPTKAVQLEQQLRDLGLRNVDRDTRDGKLNISYDPDEAPVRITEIQAELSNLLLETAQKTFQMGVGIASGGHELADLV